jgi:putative PEP-CTERM system TPR-repeat lipoprotein
MRFNKFKFALAISLGLSLVACSPTKTADEYVESAKVSIEKNEHAQAIIELKNAIKSDPKNSNAREVLGTLYLNQGAGALAEKEFNKAIEYNGNISTIIVKLLKSLSLQQKHSEVIELSSVYLDNIKDTDPEGMLYIAMAHSSLGDYGNAKRFIDIATDASTNSIYSQFGEVYLTSNTEDVDNALNVLDEILSSNDTFTMGYMLKGQLHFIKKDYEAALLAFEAYYERLPQDHKIRLFMANTYFKLKNFKEVKKHLSFILKISPNHGFSHQLLSAVYFDEGQNKLALDHSIKAIQNGLDTLFNRAIAGLSAYYLKNYEISHHYLVSIRDSMDNNPVLKRTFALVQLKLARVDEASDTILNFEELSIDNKLLAELSVGLIKNGKIEAAKSIIKKIDSKKLESPEDILQLGILKLSLGDLSNQVDLEKSLNLNPEDPLTRAALAASYIKDNQLDKALELANKWQASTPTKVDGFNLAAQIMILEGKVENAEKLLSKALLIDSSNVKSLLYFAKKDLENNAPDNAITNLNILLTARPNHLTALSTHYKAGKMLGKTKQSLELISSSFSHNKDSFSLRLLYARALFDESEYTKVVNILTINDNEKSIAPPLYWLLLGESVNRLNDPTMVVQVYRNWSVMNPRLKLAWLKYISSLDVIKEYTTAISVTENALDQIPNDAQLITLLAHYHIFNKDIKSARITLNRLSKEDKKSMLAVGVQGKIWFFENKFQKAYPNLLKLYVEQPSFHHLKLINVTLVNLKQNKQAFDFLSEHVNKHPKDLDAKNYLAESAMQGNLDLAQKHFAELIVISPNNGVFYNNFAWVEYKLGNYKVAEKLSIRANELVKNNPSLIDTLAMIKIKLGQKQTAIDLLQKATSLAPSNKEIAKHLKEATTN